jgi:septal ring factor EnvC (AmiA/AmiB activator)
MKKLLLTLTIFTLATPFFANAYDCPMFKGNKEEHEKKMAEQRKHEKKMAEQRKKIDDLQKDAKDIKKQLEEIKALLKK